MELPVTGMGKITKSCFEYLVFDFQVKKLGRLLAVESGVLMKRLSLEIQVWKLPKEFG